MGGWQAASVVSDLPNKKKEKHREYTTQLPHNYIVAMGIIPTEYAFMKERRIRMEANANSTARFNPAVCVGEAGRAGGSRGGRDSEIGPSVGINW